jgi:hypothetical protein
MWSEGIDKTTVPTIIVATTRRAVETTVRDR